MLNEIWKDIDGYVGYYQVSNRGRVRSLDREIQVFSKIPYLRFQKGIVLSPSKDKDGYLIVDLSGKKFRVSRLVASAFIDNPNKYEQVNHIDGNKANNAIENLEWCDNDYNQAHAYKIGLKKTKHFAQIDKETNLIIHIFNSLKEATQDIPHSDPSTLIKVCLGKRSVHCGYKWAYATEDMKVGDYYH